MKSSTQSDQIMMLIKPTLSIDAEPGITHVKAKMAVDGVSKHPIGTHSCAEVSRLMFFYMYR